MQDPTTLPPHDILITNPPYGEEHVRKLLKFCVFNEKPFLLLLPDYICGKDFYLPCLGSEGAWALTHSHESCHKEMCK